MGRRRQPAASLTFRYEQGPPKRIRVTLRAADGRALTDWLSTREARGAAALLLAAIDTAEADRIATRGDPTQKAKRPKRDGTRGLTKAKPVRPPSRLRRVESAAVAVVASIQDPSRFPPELRDAIAALIGEIGGKPKGQAR